MTSFITTTSASLPTSITRSFARGPIESIAVTIALESGNLKLPINVSRHCFHETDEHCSPVPPKTPRSADVFPRIASVYRENKPRRYRDCAIVCVTAARTCEDRETESRISRATPRGASRINCATRKTRCDDGDRDRSILVHPAGALSRDRM